MLKLNPKHVELGKGTNIVILTEKEYEKIIDALDVAEAERILADKTDPIFNWDDVKDTIVPTRGKNSKSRKKAQRKK